jgi:oligosaccharide reducing-end xylanase
MQVFKEPPKKYIFAGGAFTILFIVFVCVVVVATHVFGASQSPFVGAYSSGTYRVLFAERGHKSSEIQDKLNATWNQLFYGDNNTQRIYYPANNDMAYILDVGNNVVHTEGMSYGMMIAVQMNKQAEFNALWKWAMTYMYHADGDWQGYFAWECSPSGEKLDNNPASDGDEWFAMALFMASGRWGDGAGILDYRTHAQAILHNMLHHTPSNGVGQMFSLSEKQVVFGPSDTTSIGLSDTASHLTDPSYQLPAYYQLWSYWATEDNQFWSDAAKASREFFKKTVNLATGLAPDYADFDGTPKTGGGDHADFRFDAWRVASNIAVDYAWFAADPWEVTQSDCLQTFFTHQGLSTYGNQYTLSGTSLSSTHSPGLVAMNAISSLAASNSKQANSFVDALWNTPIPSGQWRYYDGVLYFMALLHDSGNFRIYAPRHA